MTKWSGLDLEMRIEVYADNIDKHRQVIYLYGKIKNSD